MSSGVYVRTKPSLKKGIPLSEQHKQNIKDNHVDFSGANHPMYGKHMSEESNRKRSEAMRNCGI